MQYEKMVKLSDNDIARCKKLYESKDRCVRPAPPAITRCMICMETCDADAVLRTSCCGEVYCASCAPRLGSMSCPRPACGMPLDARRMLAITQDVAAVTTMLLASTRREATTPASRDGKYRVLACVTPDCPGYVTYSTGARQAFQVCQVCRTAVCVTCHTTLQNHLDKTCDNAVSQYISCMGGRVKRCPECKSPISHEGGCNTMVCEACGRYFCWLCGTAMCHRSDDHAYEIAHNHYQNAEDVRADRGTFCRPGCEGLLFSTQLEYLARPGNDAYTGE